MENIRVLKQSEKEYLESYSKSLLLWPVEYSAYYVKTSFGKTHIIECGRESAPPLILLHGGSMSSTMWYPNVLVWSRHYRVIAIDIMGDKNKSIPEISFSNRRSHAEWLTEVLDEMRIEKADFVALSLGALHTTNFLLHAPERANKVVLMSPAETFVHFRPAFYSYAFGMVGSKEGVESFLQWLFNDRYALHPYIKEQLIAGMMWVETERSSKPNHSGFPCVFTDNELNTIQTPILLLLGENEVMYDADEAYIRASNTIKGITVEMVKNAGHLMSMETPAYISERVLEFLIESMD